MGRNHDLKTAEEIQANAIRHTHTPGPWTVDIHKDGGNWTWRIRGPASTGPVGVHVATVNGALWHETRHGTTPDNAALIAAAPDLLHACAELLAEADNRNQAAADHPGYGLTADTGGMILARMAIQKARQTPA